MISRSALFGAGFAASAFLIAGSPLAAERTLIQNKGSDTLVNLAQSLAEEYVKVNPDVAVAVSGGGTGTGIAAMIAGTVDLANASRAMSEKEIRQAEANGQRPVEHTIAFDALAVYLHPANPIGSMTFQQLADIYGRNGKTTRWSDLGVSVPGCNDGKIVVVSRQNNSGTYVYFKEEVLGKQGKFRQGTLDMNGSKDVVDLVEKTPCAIGYSGTGYATEQVKMPCVAKEAGGACVAPSLETAVDKSYPLARALFMYTNGEAKGAVKEYLDWILGDAGQCAVIAQGFAPVRDVKCKRLRGADKEAGRPTARLQ